MTEVKTAKYIIKHGCSGNVDCNECPGQSNNRGCIFDTENKKVWFKDWLKENEVVYNYYCPKCENGFDNVERFVSPCCHTSVSLYSNEDQMEKCNECGNIINSEKIIPVCPLCGNDDNADHWDCWKQEVNNEK